MERGFTINLSWLSSFVLYILAIFILISSLKKQLNKKRDYKKMIGKYY